MADNNIIFGEKAPAFLTKPTATTPLGSGFPFCGPALSFLSFLFLLTILQHTHRCVFPWIIKSLTHILVPSVKKKKSTSISTPGK